MLAVSRWLGWGGWKEEQKNITAWILIDRSKRILYLIHVFPFSVGGQQRDCVIIP